ncbi:MAG: glycosyltransferase [Candidatus Krumholzibacteria bacterium]|jgi:cellulose synthase/poly-beta-1,6-N-acetylglucosamine synthase-like glycosyltransferase|nr:glycosyltransferase [Candidatus Krumholzibacteria bacterium]
MVVLILKLYIVLVVLVMAVYAVRHYRFTLNRMLGRQRLYTQDVLDSDLPRITVLVPMHNEERVARQCLDALLRCSYPRDRLQIIPIDDHSTDGTAAVLDALAAEQPLIQPLHRRGDDPRGKPAALNDGLRAADGDIVLVFDADYIPSRGMLRDLAICFLDPEVGAVMGRVIPYNTRRNLLTRLLDLERSGGYQVDQQARHNLRLIPQYGGTVGGFRRRQVLELGGFNPLVLAEDTDLTFRLYLLGWKVAYANRVECFEEVPEVWEVRSRQIQRWSRGHNMVMFRYLGRVLRSRYLTRAEKLDGFLLLGIYTVPVFLLLGIIDSVILFFLGEMQIFSSMLVFLFVAAYNCFGNFAPFYEIGTAALLDGVTHRIRLLPFLTFYFLLNVWNMSRGFFAALGDLLLRRRATWAKTERFGEAPR